MEPEEPEGRAHHQDEIEPDAEQQRVAAGVGVVGMRLEAREAGRRPGVAFAAGLDAVHAAQPRRRISDRQNLVRPVTVAARRRPRRTQSGHLPVVAHPVRLVERPSRFIRRRRVTVAALLHDVADKGRRVHLRDRMGAVAVGADRGVRAPGQQLLPVYRTLKRLRHTDMALTTRLRDLRSMDGGIGVGVRQHLVRAVAIDARRRHHQAAFGHRPAVHRVQVPVDERVGSRSGVGVGVVFGVASAAGLDRL